jgi:hypothetical protein
MPATAVALNELSVVNVRPAAVVAAATDVSSAIDLTGYEGVFSIVITGGALIGGGTYLTTVTTCDTSGGTYAAVTGAAMGAAATVANTSTVIPVDVRNCKQYVKTSTVVGGTSYAHGISLVGFKKVTG